MPIVLLIAALVIVASFLALTFCVVAVTAALMRRRMAHGIELASEYHLSGERLRPRLP